MLLRRRPLLRAAGTTAVVAGTATAVSGRVARRQQNRANQAAEAQAYEQQQMYAQQQAVAQQAAVPPPAAGLTDASLEQLSKLATLHEQGVLTDDEFSAEKAKLLGL
jgi:type II secretory pathway pseudopilin PulG